MEDLLTVIVNREDVENIINRPVSTIPLSLTFCQSANLIENRRLGLGVSAQAPDFNH